MSDEIEAIRQLTPVVQDFAEHIGISEAGRQYAGRLTDRIYIKREERFALAMEKAAEKLASAGVRPQAIRDKTLAALVEGIASEDDESLQEIWANLLANAASGREVPPAYPAVLRELEPLEVQLIDKVLVRAQPPASPWVPVRDLRGLDGLDWHHLDNLERLHLIRAKYANKESEAGWFPSSPLSEPAQTELGLTPFGAAFAKVCVPPSPTDEGLPRESSSSE